MGFGGPDLPPPPDPKELEQEELERSERRAFALQDAASTVDQRQGRSSLVRPVGLFVGKPNAGVGRS